VPCAHPVILVLKTLLAPFSASTCDAREVIPAILEALRPGNGRNGEG
jgi:hypothetical protein